MGTPPDEVDLPVVDALTRTIETALERLSEQEVGPGVDELRARLSVIDQGIPTLVVCGETKRGKSSLVNALIERPRLSPVDVDLATAVYVTFSRPGDGSPEQAHVTFDDGTSQTVALDQLGDWVTVTAARRLDRQVVSAHVEVDAPALSGLVLVDTPGVGGVDSAHTRLALRAIGVGDALLLVGDAGSEFTDPELRFLEDAAARLDRVIIAITKRDKHPSGWEQVADRNRRLLDSHAPRFARAPLVAVSATYAEAALNEEDADLRELLRERSGLDELREVIGTEIVEGRRRVLVGAAARVAAQLLSELESQLAQRVAAARADPGVQEEAEREQRQVDALRDQSEMWLPEFNRDAERARAATLHEAEDAFAAFQRRWLQVVTELPSQLLKTDPPDLDGFARDLESELIELSDTTLQAFTARVDDVLGTLAATIDLARSARPEVGLGALMLPPVAGAPFEAAPAAKRGGTQLLQWGMAGNMGFRMSQGVVSAVGVGSGLGLPLVGAAVAVGAMRHFVQRQGRRDELRAALHGWVREATQKAHRTTRSNIDLVLRDLQPELMRVVRAHLRQRTNELTAIINEARSAARKSQTQRSARVASLEAGRREVAVLAEEVLAKLSELGDVRAQDPETRTV